ncbi:hypothetical protein NDN01_14015 [Sphingomonas sp. QA11]|uniref:hypothetical protein n=1 Tax=Sphingomonas sp. QA11 TaxID=2950605 RepID=UPI002349361F|nr:hypothetical protein [Sphingomonas sp. QA11]WCM25188.1 hypothetical protein NDN01_14015 [Sphingomonas sp. QA11]
MIKHVLAAGILLTASSCAKPPADTKIVNLSTKDIELNYYAPAVGRHKIHVAAGKAGYLQGVRRVADVQELSVNGPEKSYSFLGWAQKRSDNTCDGDCVVTWKSNGTVTFSK